MLTEVDSDFRFDLCVLGLGYIGLPTAVVFSQAGLRVLGVDIDADRVRSIQEQTLFVDEPGLQDALNDAMNEDRLKVSTQIQSSRNFLIAVPTPLKEDKSADLSAVWAAAEALAPVLSPGDLVILESTSPPGTTKLLHDHLKSLRTDLDFDSASAEVVSVVYCPERVMPGRILNEFATNSRVVGGIDAIATEKAAQLYAKATSAPVRKTNAATAEMVKLAENAYRDVNIAFANELSMIAAEHDVNAWELIELANNHPRVNILDPSPGVGGHCIAIDPWFLTGSDHGAALVEAARGVNNEKTQWVVDKILEEVRRGGWENIALYGLTYKPDVDDLRVSPALEIVKKSVAALPDRKIVVVDPLVRTEVADLSNATNVELVQALESARERTLHVFLVAHTAFRSLQIFADSDVGILDFVGLKSSLLSKHEEV